MNKVIPVLIADDSPFILEGLSHIFSEVPDVQLVASVYNGMELIAAVQRLLPEVVITDIQMPEMNGIEATRIIKQQFPSIAILALTAFGEDRLIRAMLEAGASGYLVKTAKREELVEAIRTVHKGGNYFCPTSTQRLAAMVSEVLTPKEPLPEFTEKEMQIIQLICQENSTIEIAAKLNHSKKTIEAYRTKIMEKINASNSTGIVVHAIRRGFFKP